MLLFRWMVVLMFAALTGCDRDHIRVDGENQTPADSAAARGKRQRGSAAGSSSGSEGSKARINVVEAPRKQELPKKLDRESAAAAAEAREKFTLTGRVLNTSGSVVANAQLMTGDRMLSATTDQAGSYVLENLPARIVESVIVSHPDHKTTSASRIDTRAGTFDFIMAHQVPTGFIGMVVDWSSRAAVSDFTVSAAGKTIEKVNGEPGKFRVTNAYEHEFLRLRVSAPGYAEQTFVARMPESQPEPFLQTFVIGPGGTARGRVVDMITRKPVAGVPVAMEIVQRDIDRTTSVTVFTAADGTFQADRITPGALNAKAVPPPPMAPASARGIVSHGSIHDFGDLAVGAFGSIEGRIIKVPGNSGVPGETVQLIGGGNPPEPQTTGNNGEFQFIGLSPGQYTVSIPKRRLYETFSVEPGGTEDVTFRIGSSTLKGTVLKDGHPYQAHLQFLRESGGQVVTSTRTGDNGQFTIAELAPGYYEALIFTGGQRGHTSSSRQGFTMPETGTYEHTFVIPSGAILGRVVDKDDKPLPGALVLKLVDNPGVAYESVPVPTVSTTAGADGRFRLENVDAGKHFLTARLHGVGSAPPTEVEVGESGDANITLRINPEETGTLVSTALNFTDGSPIPDAWCLLSTPNGRMGHGQQRGPDGIIRIDHLPAGKYSVRVSANAFSVSEREVEIRRGETTEITDVLHETGALRWKVMDENGAGIPGATCQLVPEDPNSIEQVRQGTTDQGGLWAVRGLIPGRYTATAVAPDQRRFRANIVITPRQLTIESSTPE